MKAEVFKKQSLLRPDEYRFRLVGDNGETIAQSEGYTQKHNAMEVIAKYFPNAVVKDLT